MKNRYEIRGETTVIFIERKNGEVYEVLIDTEDLERVKGWADYWHIYTNRKGYYYVICNWFEDGEYKTTKRLHRLLVDAPDGMHVDHINHNTLDNRKANLRVVTREQNMQNRRGAMSNNKIGIRGVCWEKETGKWYAYGYVNKKRYNLGRYKNIEDAIQARKEWETKYHTYTQEVKQYRGG